MAHEPGELFVVNSPSDVMVNVPIGRSSVMLRSGDLLLVIATCWQLDDRSVGLHMRTGSFVLLPRDSLLEIVG